LYLTVLPAIVGLFTVAGLAYWGRYAQTIPHVVLAVAIVATIGSVMLSWRNARYVAERVELLAGTTSSDHARVATPLTRVASALLPGRASSLPDELDAIKGVVDHLSGAVVEAASERANLARAAELKVHDYARMVQQVASASAGRMEEVRLPLHILLENHFGDLNENQEEMLGAARGAAELVDADLVALRQIAELDLGSRALRRDRLLPGDLVRALTPMLQATAETAGVTLRVDLEPLLPALHADQPQLHDALTTILGDTIRSSTSGTECELTLTRDGSGSRLTLRGGGPAIATIRRALAERIIAASGGTVTRGDHLLAVVFT
jgi:hypothetical protein